ncbi:MAG: hypothetical protein ACRDSR_14215 [Pseudonocardiaceae bacterium]
MSSNVRRHRKPSQGPWRQVLVPALLGVTIGAGTVAIATSAFGAPNPPAATQPAPSAAAPVNPPVANPPVQPAETVPSIEPIAFAGPATDTSGLSLTVLRPEKIPGGVRLTIALTNPTDAPIVVNTTELGPHNPTFDGATVPMTMSPARKRLVPGEGYTYQCVIKLPTMDVGQLEFVVGPVTVTGQAAGD